MSVATPNFRKAAAFVPLLVACLLAAGAAPAQPATSTQQYVYAWNPRSGDAWIDHQLADINAYGGRYRGAFIDELVRYHAAPRALVTGLLRRRNWAPGDVYYACALAEVAGRPCRAVVETWEQSHADGWGTVAKQLGIQDSADAKARLKQDIEASYTRWGRPLVEFDSKSGSKKSSAGQETE